MPVRKTESRIPFDFQPAELGEAVSSPDERSALVSFITSPLVVQRENIYVLFVTDSTLAASIARYEWSFIENGGTPTVESTEHGESAYTPGATGSLSITVRALDSGDTERLSLSLSQQIVALQAEIETLIAEAGDSIEPRVGNPDVARELVNDHSPYYQDVTLETPESGEAFQRFVFTMTYDGALRRTPSQRKEHLNRLAASLNSQSMDFRTTADEGVGICGVRLALLAMTVSSGGGTPPLAWTELPEPANQRLVAHQQLLETLSQLPEEQRIDLYNLARFPKSNITQCAKILEKLRNRYFSGANFNDVLTGMSGTRAHWIVRHYREGPLTR
jgi:hypothetical protein